MTSKLDRRMFLSMSGGALGFFATRRVGLPSASTAGANGVLVVVFQRGAADGLHMAVPYRDRSYRELRGALALGEPGKGERPTLDLGDGFAFHPALAPLHPLYRDGRLAVVVNVGSPDGTRSHFDAQDYMESGTPGRKSTRDGWLGRAVGSLSESESSPFTAVALTASLPRSLAGARDAIALEDFESLAGRFSDERIESAYRAERASPIGQAGEEAFRAMRLFRERDPLSRSASGEARYPRGRFASRFRQLAQLVKSDLGVRVAFLDIGGWDTHFAQGGAEGSMASSMRELSGSMAAFLDDVGRDVPVTLLTVTEFGRTAGINGAGGTDHGHGAVMLAAGAGVRGGRVVGEWHSLERKDLFEGRDLPVTTDFRDLFQEVAVRALDLSFGGAMFPGHRPKPVGVMNS
jgi:uncharacterized protein (DUF1501 family)